MSRHLLDDDEDGLLDGDDKVAFDSDLDDDKLLYSSDEDESQTNEFWTESHSSQEVVAVVSTQDSATSNAREAVNISFDKTLSPHKDEYNNGYSSQQEETDLLGDEDEDKHAEIVGFLNPQSDEISQTEEIDMVSIVDMKSVNESIVDKDADSTLNDSEGESDSDDSNRRGDRFHSERTDVASTVNFRPNPTSKREIPDTLEISKEDQQRIEDFSKGEREKKGGKRRRFGRAGKQPNKFQPYNQTINRPPYNRQPQKQFSQQPQGNPPFRGNQQQQQQQQTKPPMFTSTAPPQQQMNVQWKNSILGPPPAYFSNIPSNLGINRMPPQVIRPIRPVHTNIQQLMTPTTYTPMQRTINNSFQLPQSLPIQYSTANMMANVNSEATSNIPVLSSAKRNNYIPAGGGHTITSTNLTSQSGNPIPTLMTQKPAAPAVVHLPTNYFPAQPLPAVSIPNERNEMITDRSVQLMNIPDSTSFMSVKITKNSPNSRSPPPLMQRNQKRVVIRSVRSRSRSRSPDRSSRHMQKRPKYISRSSRRSNSPVEQASRKAAVPTKIHINPHFKGPNPLFQIPTCKPSPSNVTTTNNVITAQQTQHFPTPITIPPPKLLPPNTFGPPPTINTAEVRLPQHAGVIRNQPPPNLLNLGMNPSAQSFVPNPPPPVFNQPPPPLPTLMQPTLVRPTTVTGGQPAAASVLTLNQPINQTQAIRIQNNIQGKNIQGNNLLTSVQNNSVVKTLHPFTSNNNNLSAAQTQYVSSSEVKHPPPRQQHIKNEHVNTPQQIPSSVKSRLGSKQPTTTTTNKQQNIKPAPPKTTSTIGSRLKPPPSMKTNKEDDKLKATVWKVDDDSAYQRRVEEQQRKRKQFLVQKAKRRMGGGADREGSGNEGRTVRISNLASKTKPDKLKKLMKSVGLVESLDMYPDENSAMATFEEPHCAQQFAEKFNRYFLDLSYIAVSLAATADK